MGNLDQAKSPQELLDEYILQLKKQRNFFIFCRVLITILLCGFLVLVFLLFSFNFYLFPNEHFCLEGEGRKLMWIAVSLVFVCLLWLVAKSSLQLKQFRKDIRRLEMLSLRAKIQSTGAEEEICRVLKSYYEIESKPKVADKTATEDVTI